GGALGKFIAELLIQPFNPLGASIVSLFVFITALVISTPVRVASAIGRILATTSQILWKVLRATLRLLAWGTGWLLMKIFHHAGDALRTLLEISLRRARERAQRIRQSFDRSEPLSLEKQLPLEVPARTLADEKETENDH